DYFDRLDAAFSNLAAAPALGGKSAAPAATITEDIDWIGRSREEPADLPLTYGSSPTMKHTPPELSELRVGPAKAGTHVDGPHVDGPHVDAPRVAPPPLADAFAALLAAEQDGSIAAMPPTWPSSPAGATGVTDEAIEEIVRRVLDRLSDRVVRETA